jgi:hypothetical protein
VPEQKLRRRGFSIERMNAAPQQEVAPNRHESMERSTVMISKAKIGIILASAMVSCAMVYYGIASRHHQEVQAAAPPVEQKPTIPKPQAGTPLDATNDPDQADTATDPNASDQQSVDPNQDQGPADDQADAADSDQEQDPSAAAQQNQPTYPVRVVRLRPVVRVVHVISPAVAAVIAHEDRPVTPVAPVLVAPARGRLLVPAGTSLMLRLSEPLGSKISETDQSFAATLDRDINVNGKTLIAAGAPVIGKVVVARRAGPLTGEANLQLKVTSINVKDHELDVLSSVQSFGPTVEGKSKFSRFLKGVAKRAEGNEHEVVLEEQTEYEFKLVRPLEIQ